MGKMNVANLHDKLTAAGIPLHGLAMKDNKVIRIDFKDEATDDQKTAAQKIVDEYDPDAEAGTQDAASAITDEEIDSAKSVADLKALLKKLRKG